MAAYLVDGEGENSSRRLLYVADGCIACADGEGEIPQGGCYMWLMVA